jgi:1-pyrroline-5-carboxylate dehydrogenase
MTSTQVQLGPAVDLKPFRNEPFTDFRLQENAERMRRALERVRAQLGREYDLIIGGRALKTKEKLTSINPSRPSEVVGVFQKAGAGEVAIAVEAALRAFEQWKQVAVEERAQLLLRVAKAMRERKFELSAWMVVEVGKNWAEADADIGEAIDFCEYYAHQALRLAKAEPSIQYPGERDYLWYIPLGVGAVIPPWNFPLAITAGMTMASIVCGNTVILKPSSDAPAIAAKLMEVLTDCGMPDGVVNYCTGSGSAFGNGLVAHPKTRFIAFTGSREVGLQINQLAAETQPGQIWIKRAILEMGGKDSILVDADADLDAAVEGVAASAFGFQGQKCSACSRAIVDLRIYDKFLERLKNRVEKITVDDAESNPGMGPVVNRAAMDKILSMIDQGLKEGGRLITGGAAEAGEHGDDAGAGYFIKPTVIADVDPMATIAQEEIFGPVLAVIPCRDFDQGLAVANNTVFGLTGSYYGSSEERIARAMREFHVGNFYVNRKSTGAMVGAHPFGGFNMSGTDSKAGGPDYLYLFTQAKSIGRKL